MKTLTEHKQPLAVAITVVLMLGAANAAQAVDQSGTTLTTTKTATGFWEQVIEHDWTVTKEVSPNKVELGLGESATVQYIITTTKTAKAPVDSYGSIGNICVTNGGGVATENLSIIDNVQAKVGKGQFTTISFNPVDTSAKPILGTGESYCYPYRVTFAPVTGATYRNEAKVTITNHSGWFPGGTNCPGTEVCAFGPQYRVGFALPSTATLVYKDASATISDTFTKLDGFSVAVADADKGPWTHTDAGTISFSATVKNDDADCNKPYNLTNTATLVESDTQQERSGSAVLGITTKDCSQPSFSGCTYTQGYWKNITQHPWPASVVANGMFLGNVHYSYDQLTLILGTPPATNYLSQLANQLIAAKLNAANVPNAATGGSLYGSIASADALIGDLVVAPVGDGFLTSDQASAVQNALTLFNQGGPTAPGNGDYDLDNVLDGPPHCPK